MIHAFALEPEVVASWCRREEFRFIHDKFGVGTPRVLLELPAFTEWKNAVYDAAGALELSEKDWKRLEELFRIFTEHRCRRADRIDESLPTWLESAEREHARREFRGIIAAKNPRNSPVVILGEDVGHAKARQWVCDLGATPNRTADALAAALSAMVFNCRDLHLIDPHFGPENARHRKVIEALMEVASRHGALPQLVRIHCRAKTPLAFFETEAANKLATRLPRGCKIEFVRWQEKAGGEKLHNRYVLTDVGGVSLGVGLDAGDSSESDDVLLLPRPQYTRRWAQYVVDDGAFERVDTPRGVSGTRSARAAGRPP